MTMKDLPASPLPRLAWSIAEAAKILGVSAGFIRKVIDAGEIPVRRLGRRVVIKDSDLRDWLDKRPELRGLRAE